MPKPATRPDLILRFEALSPRVGRTEFESRHSLPQNFIGKLKMGLMTSASSLPNIQRLEDAIKRHESGDLTPLPDPIPEAPRQGRPTKLESASEEDLTLIEELVEAVESSNEIEKVDDCNKKVTIALLRGVITDATARVLKELIAERRQSLHAIQDREEKAKAGREMIIRVVHVPNWTGGPLPGEGPQS